MKVFAALLCYAFLSFKLFAAEHRPSSSDIDAALAAARSLRQQAQAVPELLQSQAWVLKVGGVRCGQVLVAFEDGSKDGAAYRFTEQYKAANSDNGKNMTMDYSGVYLLNADLSIQSAVLNQKFDGGPEGSRSNSWGFEIKAGNLVVKPDPRAHKPESTVKLHGEHPVPSNALFALAVLSGKQPGFKLDNAKPLCVPALFLRAESTDVFTIEPAYVSVNQAVSESSHVLQVSAHRLVGELSAKGMEVDAPSPQIWRNARNWTLDTHWRLLTEDAPPGMELQSVDTKTLDANAPFEFDKIERAMKALTKQ